MVTLRIDTEGLELAPGVPRTYTHRVWRSKELGFALPFIRDLALAMGADPNSEIIATDGWVGKQCKVTFSVRNYKDKSTGDARQTNDITKVEKVV